MGPMVKSSEHISNDSTESEDASAEPVMSQAESAAVAARRAREKRTISQMIALYCAGNHADSERVIAAHCGERVCEKCAAIDAYAVLRTDRCRKMGEKTSCEQCENHCYRAAEREKIREIMRYSGPRMMTKHPIAAVRHLLGK